MEKKPKVHLTNEKMTGKFKSSFDLVNYAIKLAENMIYSGREARVKSEIQNRAMLILEEIHEGKDQFDEINGSRFPSPHGADESQPRTTVHEERTEKRKYRTAETFHDEE
jgi:hypothetical protein